MADRGNPSRRQLLGAVGVATVGSVAGCNGNGDDSNTSSPDTQTEPEESDTNSTETSESPAETVVFTDSETDPPTAVPEDFLFDGGDAEDFKRALQKAATLPDATVEIASTTYRFSPLREKGEGGTWWHIRAPDIEDVTVEGNGATILYTEPRAAGLYFNRGANITVQNLTVDYDPVPFTQGDVIDISADKRTIELELDEGYPSLDHQMFDAFDAPGGSVHTPDGEFISGVRREGRLDKYYSTIERVGNRRYRLQLDETCTTAGLGPNRKLLIKARRSKPAFYFLSVDNPEVSNVTVHASNGGGFLMDVCDSPTVRDCVVAPPEDSNRLIGIDSDGVRFVNDTGPPTVENSRFEYTGDDPIVVQQTMSPVKQVIDERTVRIAQWHPFVVGPDDTLRGMTQTGVVLGELPPIESLEFRSKNTERGKPETITFTEPIDDVLSETDLIKNSATASREFTVRNNTVRNVRGRLIRIAASDGVVENNTLEGSHSSAVEIECDTDDVAYQPKGGVSNVEVRNNDITRPGLNYLADQSPGGVRIHHLTREGVPNKGRPNRDIVVKNNRIERGAHSGIEVEYAKNVHIEGNQLADLNRLSYLSETEYGVHLTAVDSGTITRNSLEGAADTIDSFGALWESTDIETAENTVNLSNGQAAGNFDTRHPVTFSFEPTASDREYQTVGVRCYRLSLLDEDEQPILETNLGKSEDGIGFGDGVEPPSRHGGDSWRWFGKFKATARVYLTESQLSRAETLSFDVVCPEPDIEAQLQVDGSEADRVPLDSGTRRTYTFSLNTE